MIYHILCNPLSGNGLGMMRVQTLKNVLNDGEVLVQDIREQKDVKAFVASISAEDALILAGGDGTLNRFVNDTEGVKYPERFYYYPTGSGNDFLNDVKADERGLILMTPYVVELPSVTVKNKTCRFINGIGYGIDGYCCEEGDRLRNKSTKPVNYTSIAIKGLLFKYKRTNAKVTVDGKSYEFKNVWLAPTMNGRYYGGGMMVAPDQDRLNPRRELTLVVLHDSSSLKTLMVFPSIFKGEHVRHTDIFTVLKGKEITVRYDRPVALQIDGETVTEVTEYKVSAYAPAKIPTNV